MNGKAKKEKRKKKIQRKHYWKIEDEKGQIWKGSTSENYQEFKKMLRKGCKLIKWTIKEQKIN